MIIDGKQLAKDLVADIQQDASEILPHTTPTLAIVTIGEEESWKTYVTQKKKRAEEIGFATQIINLTGKTTEEIVSYIQQLNADHTIHGIIVQRPLPSTINTSAIVAAIDKNKDVDGFRADSPFQPPLWLAVHHILTFIFMQLQQPGSLSDWLASQQITVIGKGETAGQPIISGLKKLQITPSIVDSKTLHADDILQSSDIVISGVGKDIIDPLVLKAGVILIGIGIRREDGKLKGDYDEGRIESVASFYTPTPGGVGPVNLAFLMRNLLHAAKSNN